MADHEMEWARANSDATEDFARWAENPIQQVDFAIHTHYLRAYIGKQDRVLEMGAGAGRFTRELAELSERVVVADISPEKLQRNRRNAAAVGYDKAIEAWVECDMCNLEPHFRDGEFDAVVCYGGPLSYVFDRRENAISELVRVTKSGGLMFLSARSLWGTVHHTLPAILQIDPRINREIVATGDLGPGKVAISSRFLHVFRAKEFVKFVEDAGAQVLVASSSGCLSATWQDLLGGWRDNRKIWEHLLELEIEACRQDGCLDLGTHILVVARKQ